MNLLNVQTFLYIVRTQSISAAAKAMYTSQPTISSRLLQLESDLGVQLIIRSKGRKLIELTQKGQDFIPIAEHWLELDLQTRRFAEEESRTPITIVAPGSYQEHILPSLVHRLLGKMSGDPPEIRLVTSNSQQVYSQVMEHSADVGLATRLGVHDGTLAFPVFSTEYVIICPADSVLPEGRISPRLLDPRDEVSVTSWTGDTRRWHDTYWDKYAPVYLQVDNNHMTHHYLDRPTSWAICPASIAVSIQKQHPDKLGIRRLAPEPPRHTCYMVLPRTRSETQSRVLSEFIRCIREYAQETYLLTPLANDLPQ